VKLPAVVAAPPWLAARRLTAADLRADGNAFTALRWLLASAVMISHAWDLTQAQRGLDPSVALLGYPISRLAVFLFFTLSGFLVAGSLFKRGVIEFLKARALRLLPGLWVMLLLVPLGLWAAFGTMSLGAFLADPETHRFWWRNALLLGKSYSLPGLFEAHRLPGVINGSLWTIPHEVRCYLALAAALALGLAMPRRRFTIVILIGLALTQLLPPLPEPLQSARGLFFSFFIGVFAWLWRERLWLSWPLGAAAAALALLLPIDVPGRMAVAQIGFGYAALVMAFASFAGAKAASARMPDYSYGIYIYGFPMQQAAIALGAVTPLANLGLGFAMTVVAAGLSWHLVEKPALALKAGKTLPTPAG
jgi:peptidoglycan/LPS O-acetylase OafA/YrhL